MHKKKVAAIIMYWYPYVGPLQPIYKAVFMDIANSGYSVDIITGIPHYRRGRRDDWSGYRGLFYKKRPEDGLHVRRTYVFSPRADLWFDKNGILRRTLNYFTFFFSCLISISKDRGLRPDLLFVPSFPPLFGALIAVLASKVKRAPFIYNVQDLYPDVLYSLKLFRFGPIAYLVEKAERLAWNKASHIVVITGRIKEILEKKGISGDKISVIPNFCDTDFIRPLKKNNEFSKEFGLADKFVVLFAGNIGEPQGIENIMEAAEIIGRKQKRIGFVFVGRGERRPYAENLAKDKKLENVRFLPLQPLEKMPSVWASADISLVSLRKNLSNFAFPSKIYNILSSARPVLAVADRGSDVWKFIEESKAGLSVEAGDAAGLADKILYLYNNPLLRETMARNGRQFIINKYSKDGVICRYRAIFDNI